MQKDNFDKISQHKYKKKNIKLIKFKKILMIQFLDKLMPKIKILMYVPYKPIKMD